MTTVRFSGESPWNAVINHNSLDIVEEVAFLAWCIRNGIDRESSLSILEAAFERFEREKQDD
jgi:hypothetical protein